MPTKTCLQKEKVMGFVVFVLIIAAGALGWHMDVEMLSTTWWTAGGLLVLTLAVGSRNGMGELLAIIPGACFVIALVAAIVGSLKSAFIPATQTTVVVSAAEVASDGAILVFITTLTEAPYTYTAVVPLLIFLTFCFAAWLYDSDWTGTGFLVTVVMLGFLFTGAAIQGDIISFILYVVTATIIYALLGWLYAIHWYKNVIDERYQPYFSRLDAFLDEKEISLPEGVAINEFDVLDPDHMDQSLVKEWLGFLNDDRAAREAANAIERQTVAHEGASVFEKMVGWPGVAFGDFISSMWRLISSSLKDAATYPFRKRTAKQTKGVRSTEQVEAALRARN